MTIKIISRKYAQFNEALKLRNDILLNSDSHLPKKKIIICFNDSSSKMVKNVFYFILKALFVLKIFDFLS